MIEAGFGNGAISSIGQLVTSAASREVIDSQLTDQRTDCTYDTHSVREPLSVQSQVITRRSFLVRIPSQSAPWRVTFELTRDPPREWYTCEVNTRAEESEIILLVNLAHPFSEQFINESEESLAPIMRIVAALALSEQTARLSGISHAGEIRRRMNELLRHSLSQAKE